MITSIFSVVVVVVLECNEFSASSTETHVDMDTQRTDDGFENRLEGRFPYRSFSCGLS